ncbi:MAG: hypothetical protein P8Z00_18115 [Anaerolineales bacterium]|jgi:hypothetical protein
MKTNRIWFWVITLLAITVLSACGSRSNEGQITEQPLAVNSLWFQWTSLPVDALVDANQEEIADQLFSMYLEQFKDESTDKSIRLIDFKILRATLSSFSQKCAKELGVESIVDIQYSVEPEIYLYSDWNAGTGSSDGSGKGNAMPHRKSYAN